MSFLRRRRPALPPITRVEVLDLGPDDRLLVHVPANLTPEAVDRLRAHLERVLGTDAARVVVLAGDITVSVLPEGGDT